MMPASSLIDAIDTILPQTQCTKCGYDGCRPYAQAIATQGVPINRCPPGGQAGIGKLARLLHQAEIPLDLSCGEHQPLRLAVIDETHCIGCTLCIQACPVDAIVGANKQMHTVIPELCTGCDLCVPPCPVDCIDMRPAGFDWTPDMALQARQRHDKRQQRLNSLHPEASPLAARNLANKAPVALSAAGDPAQRQQKIADVLARARARRNASATHRL